jgi:glycosyltransferase involved in cell wall biosynthesis
MSPSDRKLLINCSNLHVGGGVAVAASFIDSLSRSPQGDVHLLLSSAVAANLHGLGTRLDRFAAVEIADFHGLRSLWQGLSKRFEGFATVFTVFGPVYALRLGRRHVVGFAQALILYPPTATERRLPLLRRLQERLKFRMQERFFARSHELVVEMQHVKAALQRRRLFSAKPVHIVMNTVDTVFREPRRWLPVSIPKVGPAIRLGIVSRNYLHKNLQCLAELKAALARHHGLAAEVFVTFNEAEWSACTPSFRAGVHNVGALSLAQCPSFYAAMDGVVFPSLCESFSSSPLEAMLMRKPLFASDLPFIHDCCGEHAHVFDPLDLQSMAAVIASYFQHRAAAERLDALEHAHAFVSRYPSADERARSYMAIARGEAGTRTSAAPPHPCTEP